MRTSHVHEILDIVAKLYSSIEIMVQLFSEQTTDYIEDEGFWCSGC